ncbi:peptidoglycan/xylan/chitin deacetylase (PgdA/CDA1 family) [Luteibacter sp. Sphag1AF]|uniref:polysaccharide deacetylase family protein n=1 Tax=Luteibacter sp. Sphag1AF TaxID=2587031 RepID=UPI001610FB2C|nr:polysaccharide deacetylase family protein [Luteibacter sp. Sphag1AF]MBB3228577.1 peptidoglycan/xylan/chitin deacetylase (PgdA/CDA1 family) [Luteibacter sp. Sphag1AF]
MSWKPSKNDLLGLLPDRLVLTRGGAAGQARYLSFDDGPDPVHTEPLLDLLARHDAKASFFLVGKKIEKHPDIVRRIVADGHMIGNHSYSHWSFTHMNLQKQLDEVHRTDALLSKFDRRDHHAMRPPHGYVGAGLMLHFAIKRRSFIYWSYDSLDYQVDMAREHFIRRLREQPPGPGDIVLMHDDNARALDALEILLPEWRRSGFHFRALPAGD